MEILGDYFALAASVATYTQGTTLFDTIDLRRADNRLTVISRDAASILLTEFCSRIRHYGNVVPQTSIKVSAMKQTIGRLIDTYDNAVQECRETSRSSS